MRTLIIVPLVLLGCSKAAPPDLSKPQGPIEALVAAAASSSDEHLAGLCDPKRECDRDALELCALKSGAQHWDRFVEQFDDGTPYGQPRVKGDKAEVRFMFDDGHEIEKFQVVQRDGRWYLAAF